MNERRDPREIVTPDAFRVHQDLLGIPLAGPMRRGVAMLIDLLFISLILLLKTISTPLFWLLVAWVLFRISTKGAEGGIRKPVARVLVRIAAVAILVVAIFLFFGSCAEWVARFATTVSDGTDEQVEAGAEEGEVTGAPSLGDVARAVGDAVALSNAETPEEARPVAARLARNFERGGASPEEARIAMEELAGEDAAPWMTEVIAAATGASDSASRRREADLDELVTAYGEALSEGDTARAATLRPRVLESLAGDRLERLEAEIRALRRARDSARAEAAEGTSIIATIRDLADELGIGIGWIGLYFTVFTAVSNGRTPGKRIMGIRVVRLNGEPITWWTSFSRFGGYAACFFTGMIGFIETFWDANRQGLQDKIVGTVVIRTGKAPEEQDASVDAEREERMARLKRREEAQEAGPSATTAER